MSFAFDRPIGAPADVTELDYVAALHQTDVPGGIRKDGSIQGEFHVARALLWKSKPVSADTPSSCHPPRLTFILHPFLSFLQQISTLACFSLLDMVSVVTKWARGVVESRHCLTKEFSSFPLFQASRNRLKTCESSFLQVLVVPMVSWT